MSRMLVAALALLLSVTSAWTATSTRYSTGVTSTTPPQSTSAKPPSPELSALRSEPGVAIRVWWDKGGLSWDDFVCYKPHRPTTEWNIIGHRGQGNHDDLETFIYAFSDDNHEALFMANDFTMIWDDRGSAMREDGSVWRAICPPNYVAVGDFFYKANRVDKPGSDLYYEARCVRKDLTEPCKFGEKIWDDSWSLASNDVSVWGTVGSNNSIGGFLYANGIHETPPDLTPNCLKKRAFKEA